MRVYGAVALSRDGSRWVISRAEPHISIRLKQIFPSIPKAAIPPYDLPHTLTADTDLDWFMQRYPLAISDADRAAMSEGREAFRARQAEMERILMPDYAPSGSAQLREGQQLRPYQWQAIEVLRRRGRLLLGDEGGLGKTYTAAGFMVAEPGSLPAAVVCDAHMQRQWKEKIEAFTHLRVHLIKKGSPYNLPEADAYVYRISQVAGWANIFATGFFKSVTYDEPQSLRTGAGTGKGAACKVLSAHTDFHLGLTATPIYNHGDEMWHIMQFIDDSVLGSWPDFEREWCDAIGNGKYRIKDPKALGTYLREQYAMIRRLKSDVGQQLPKVSRVVEHIDYDGRAVAAVEDLARALAIKATTASFVERGNAARELDIMMRQTTGVAKARTVAAFARLMVEAGEAVVLWGWHREVYAIWNQALRDLKPAMYTGSESASRKEAAKRRFLEGETDILIMSLRSGAGVDGLQLRCCTGIFGELDWSPGIHAQCIWRLDREGQQNPVTAFFLVTDDGSDPPMMDVLGIKASEAQNIVDPHLGVEVRDNDTSHLRRLVERYLDRKAVAGAG
ncbi:SNF2-related protein [Aquisphaera insulae]|uniref:SNF2-related protein n=1 Tax=Aquisphaera insulae TaxID=2712864 RepID=UPI0013EC3F65|nr:DEAD/DEAH box helicase [Aquisphaera insulae]